MGIGELMAASAAACWATSSVIYGRTRLTASTINLAKNLYGLMFVFLHLWCLWFFLDEGFLHFSGKAWFYLVISGVVGIAAGDTCFFRSMQILGPRRALVVATFAPVFGGVLGWVLLGEALSGWTFFGIAIAIFGISFVIIDKRARKESPGHYPGNELAGVGLGMVAAFCQAGGLAVSKIAMQECTPLEATFVRLLAAVVCGVILFRLGGRFWDTAKQLVDKRTMMMLVPAAAIGTWLGIWFSQIGGKHADIAIATMLMSTSPLFAIPLVWYFDGHRISIRSVIGTIIAIAGIVIAVSS